MELVLHPGFQVDGILAPKSREEGAKGSFMFHPNEPGETEHLF
jgi:hypothetical protein